LTAVNSYIYCQNNPSSLVDPRGKFGVLAAFVVLLGVSAGVSAIQAGIQVAIHGGNFWDHFAKNFGINFVFSFLGLGIAALSGAKEFALGWGGVYTTKMASRGFSLGFFQSTAGSQVGTARYWHEVGHTINFAIAGSVTHPDHKAELLFGWFFIHGIGSFGGPNNLVMYLSEGGADLWSSPAFSFAETKLYMAEDVGVF
jgi:hypothetical protein